MADYCLLKKRELSVFNKIYIHLIERIKQMTIEDSWLNVWRGWKVINRIPKLAWNYMP
jgi:hypothetical protein